MLVPDADGGADFEITTVDSIPLLAFRPQGVAEARWADFHALDLEVVTQDGTPARLAPEAPPTTLQNRWLTLKDALLVTNERSLAHLLGGLRFDAAGIHDLRLVPTFDAFQIIGRATANGREATFSIRLDIRPSPRSSRYVEIDLSNVRLFGFVDIPAPRLGVALALSLATAISAISPAHVVARGAGLEVDLLEIALAQFLVARGWRLPRVRTTHLMALDWVANRLQLHFSSALEARPGHASVSGGPEAALLEVELTEEGCRKRCLEDPSDRQSYLRWLAFRVAARAPDAVEMTEDAVKRDPTDMSSLLLAAIAVAEAGAPAEAAGYFLQAARVADAASEIHDAELAREAAAVQRPEAALESEAAEAAESRPPDDDGPDPLSRAPGHPFESAPQIATEIEPDFARQSTVSEALRLTSALHSLRPTALEESLEIQEKLATIHMQLGDWATAEGYVESVLRRDPTRISMLEKQIEIHQQRDRYEDAARGYARLAQLYPSPRQRAQALFAEGELRRELLGDDAGAIAAYLKSSDLDPAFVPTARQLLAWFWRSGAFAEVASIGDDLARTPSALEQLDVKERVRLAASGVLADSDTPLDSHADGLESLPFDSKAATAVLIEVAVARLESPISDLSPVVTRLLAWERSAGGAVAANTLAATLRARLEGDVAEPGAARALGALFDVENDSVRAGVCFTLAVFLEPGDGAAARLGEISATHVPSPAADGTPHLASADPLSVLAEALADDSRWQDPQDDRQDRQDRQDRPAGEPEDLSDGERRASWVRTPEMAALFLSLVLGLTSPTATSPTADANSGPQTST